MEIQKLFLPLSVVASAIAVYVFIRNGNPNQQTLTPNTASSGVPASYTLSGVATPASYQLDQVSIPTNPTPAQTSAAPSSSNPGGGNSSSIPPYLTFNFWPTPTATLPGGSASQPATACCGSGKSSPCSSNQIGSGYMDGGGTKLAASSTQQTTGATSDAFIQSWGANVAAYAAMETGPQIPSLTSTSQSGSLEGTPTNGTPYSHWIN